MTLTYELVFDDRTVFQWESLEDAIDDLRVYVESNPEQLTQLNFIARKGKKSMYEFTGVDILDWLDGA